MDRIDVNRADAAELAGIPGITEALADAIVAARAAAPLTGVRDLAALPGITVDQLVTLAEHVHFADPRAATTALPPGRSLVQGRVVDLTNGRAVEGATVVVYVATTPSPTSGDFTPLVGVTTERAGYFQFLRPTTGFTAANAAVTVNGVHRVPIRLADPDPATGTGLLPERLVLVVEPAKDPLYSSGCGCEDLTFSARGEVLEEFSYFTVVRTTDPEITPLVLAESPSVTLDEVAGLSPILEHELLKGVKGIGQLWSAGRPPGADAGAGDAAVLKKMSVSRSALEHVLTTRGRIDGESVEPILHVDAAQKIKGLLKPTKKPAPGRVDLTADTAIDWDASPTLYQATTLAFGHVLHLSHEWSSDGYSLGDLLYSLPLAPGQKKQVVMVDWERRESAANVQSQDYQESLDNALSRDRDVNEIAKGSVSERSRGGSESNVWGWGVGGGVGAILPIEVPIGALVGAGGGGGHADASAWQRSSRKTSASTMQSIRDATVQSANAVRSQRSTVVQSVTQGERFEVSAESVANYNHCHALTIEYFEVLRHFRIDQRLVDVSECVFVPFAMSLFDSDKAIRWKEVLSRYLLDRRLRGGFAALERIAADYAGSDLPTGIFADEQLTHVDGELRLVLKLARPADDADGAYAADSWRWMRALLPWTDPAEFHARYLAGTDARDEAFARAVGQQVAEAIVDNIAVTAVLDNGEERDLKLDLSLVSDFRNGVPMTVTARMTGPLGALRRRDIAFVRVASTVTTLTFPDLSALFPETDFTTTVPTLATVLPSHSRLLVDAGFLSYRTAHRSDHLFRDQRIRNDLSGIDDVVVHTPLNTEELRNPRREDQELAARLLAHLNDNIEFYHKVIWTTMTPERRFLLLDRIKGPASVGGRSLASIVENRVLGVVGNCVVMPVAAGFVLDPALEKALVDPVTGEARTLLDLYQPEPVDPIRVSVPTKGVFAEAVMGRCNSCEKKEEDRFWRWEESPIPDSPTAILPASTDSRRAEPPDLTPQQFPTPVVTVQNAPSLPDPAGLAGILALLGNADTFRDMAGLSETQRNSLAALQRAMGTAEYFGGQAAGLTNLAAQVYMAKEGIDKTLSKIQQAKDQQLIDPGTATALTKKALESALPATAAEPGVTATKEFGDIVRSAATSPDAEIAVTRPGGEAVSIRKRGATTAEDSGTGPSADGDRPAPRPDRPSDPPSRPGLFATPDERLTAPPLGMLVAYFSQWENDERVPPGARRLFSRGRVQSLGQQLRADHLDHHRSTAEPLDAAMVAELARRLAASTEPAAAAEFLALLLCHNHTRSQSRRLSSISYESMALPWDRTGGDDTAVTYRYRVFDDESNATFQDFEIALERGALPADIYEVGGAPSGFYLLYDPDELGHDDPADWYHYFLTRTVTHGIAAGVVERTGGIGPALDDWSAYSVGLYEIVTWVAGLLRDAQPDADVTDERFDAWLFANALSFLEEAYYGTSGEQGETVREGHAQHRGAREAVLALSDAGFAPVWRWFVPRAGTLQVYLGDLLDEASSAGPSAALRIGERLADLASSITPFVDQIWDFDGAVLVAADVPLGEHVPARAEADASGAATGVVAAGSPEFDALVRLDDPTVVVKDEEGSGADRMMTPRLAELVGALAAHVAQAFPGRRLRLTEAWDPDGEHSHSSLHYEGRAADLTVDDRDRAKLGRLAALAVQTGFDWVLHENDHVHVSVRAG